jgi:peptidoglycan/xylan/chitin deacetylase (PgdA/CDA1 family)
MKLGRKMTMRKLWLFLLSIGLTCLGMLVLLTTNIPGAYAEAHLQPMRQAGGSIALTFDDGPSAFTPQILSVLQQYGVHATFFDVGQQAQARPGLVRETYQMGDVIGNHAWSHSKLTSLAPSQVKWQLSRTSAAIQRATGVSPTVFRPPYGATNATVTGIARPLGLSPVLWSVDSLDWQRPGVAAIVNNVLKNARNGSVVLMHDGGGDRSETVQALPQIINGLRQRGFVFVTA